MSVKWVCWPDIEAVRQPYDWRITLTSGPGQQVLLYQVSESLSTRLLEQGRRESNSVLNCFGDSLPNRWLTPKVSCFLADDPTLTYEKGGVNSLVGTALTHYERRYLHCSPDSGYAKSSALRLGLGCCVSDHESIVPQLKN